MTLSKEEKAQTVRLVQNYFIDQQMDEIGNLAAEQLIDYMMEITGPYVYNQAISDVNKTLRAHNSQLEDALFILEKPTRR